MQEIEQSRPRFFTPHKAVRHFIALVFVSVSALIMAPAQATPDVSPEAFSKFLRDHGILDDAKDQGLVEQVRDRASGLVLDAMNFLGVPYRRGGVTAQDGFDCSGFTRFVFEQSLGLVLPRRADGQAKAPGLLAVKRDELKPGDLVFFNTLRRTFSHVGIYVGDGKFIHAPHTGSKVRIDDIGRTYWAKRFSGARRADGGARASSAPIDIAAFLGQSASADTSGDGADDDEAALMDAAGRDAGAEHTPLRQRRTP